MTALAGSRDDQRDRHESEPAVVCPITRRPCVGDLSGRCEDYGCARKGGLLPYSGETL
jgi:hypothetical protein